MIIVWFRNDLRLCDHEPLIRAMETGEPILPLYIHEPGQPAGVGKRWWTASALYDLSQRIPLLVRHGHASEILPQLVEETKAKGIYVYKRYDPMGNAIDDALRNLPLFWFAGFLLLEPWVVRSPSDSPYRVFTPFYKNASARSVSSFLHEAPPASAFYRHKDVTPLEKPAEVFPWTVTEEAALQRLRFFCREKIRSYAIDRDFPGIDGTSRLSPYINSGMISVHRILHEATSEAFIRELWWRDFAYHLIDQDPDMLTKPMRREFEHMPWRMDEGNFARWTKGQTGYPIVDAGMRQLLETGWMHNRVRMIVGSFLVKHLMIPWQAGAAWFMERLVDIDLVINAMSWQWVAGCGADAAPFFRIFNPSLQAEKFDPDRIYVHQFLGSDTGDEPMVDHKEARAKALAALESLKKGVE